MQFILIVGFLLCAGFVAVLMLQPGPKPASRLQGMLRELERSRQSTSMSAATQKGSVNLAKMLASSNYAQRKKAETQFLKILRFALMGSLGFTIYTNYIVVNPPEILKAVSSVLVGGTFFIMMILKQQKSKRKEAIELGLVNVIDLAVIGLEAGMTLQSVFREVVSQQGNKKDPLTQELIQMLAELDAGLDITSAIRGLAARCEIEELNMLASAIIQAERVGSGLAQTFRIYGEDLRSTRREKIKTQIQKLPVKMLFPLMLFLVSMMCLITGPAALQFITQMSSL